MLKKAKLLQLLAGLVLFTGILFVLSQTSTGKELKTSLEAALRDRLTAVQPLPSGERAGVVYILGGRPDSLRLKFRVAASLYKRGAVEEIWFMHVSGITRYSTRLGRNLASDEWSQERLAYYGVPEKAVEAVAVDEGFFGTLSEARSIAALLGEQKMDGLVVVSSPHHTRRVKLCFEHYLGSQRELFIEASREEAPLAVLLREFCKLKFYQLLLFFDNPGV